MTACNSPSPASAKPRGWDVGDGNGLNGEQPGSSFLDGQAPPVERPRWLNLQRLADFEPVRPEFLLPSLSALPLGEPTLLSADGGTGKSQFALLLGVCVALGIPFFGEPVQRRRVAYISFEDPQEVMHWRLSRACFAAQVMLRDLVGRLDIMDGTTASGAWYSRSDYGAFGLTNDYAFMQAQLVERGAELIIVDGSADVFAGNENDRAHVKAFVRGLRALTPRDGALLLLAHVDKASVGQGGSSVGYSGSTGWNNSVRSRLFMFKETEEEEETGNVAVEVRKSNYGKTGGRLLLRYDESYDIFRRVDTPPEISPDSKLGKMREADNLGQLKAIIREAYELKNPIPATANGIRSSYGCMSVRAGFPDSYRSRRGRMKFYQDIEKLRAAGEIVTEDQRRGNRHHIEVFRLP